MDERLINEAIAGSREAFAGLYGAYKDRLYRYALYRLGSPEEAEDAVSECVLAAWKNIGSLRSSKAFGSWIFRILSNCCAARIKDAVSSRENIERVIKEGGFTPGGSNPSLAIELNEALAGLGDEDREIVLLSVIAGMTSGEISEQTGLPAGTVRSKLSRSLAKMREFLS